MGLDHEDIGLQSLWVTEASVDEASAFMREQWVPYPVLADAEAVRKSYGIDLIWGSPVFLVDRDGVVVAEELGPVERFLAREQQKR